MQAKCDGSEESRKEIYNGALVVQWLRLQAPNAEGPGLIPGQGARSQMLHSNKYFKRIINIKNGAQASA